MGRPSSGGSKRGIYLAAAMLVVLVGGVLTVLLRSASPPPPKTTIHSLHAPAEVASTSLIPNAALLATTPGLDQEFAVNHPVKVVKGAYGTGSVPELIFAGEQLSAVATATSSDTLATFAKAVAASLDSASQTTTTTNGVTYVCATLVDAQTPTAACAWVDGNIVAVVWNIANADLNNIQEIAVQAHNAAQS